MFDTPLLKRKKLLKKILPKSELIRYNDHILEKGNEFFETIAKFDLEGLIAKKVDGFYFPGKRTSEWVKIKTHTTKDAIICGFTDPGGSRKYFGSLVMGMEDEGKLRYVGNVGTGFDDRLLKSVHEKMLPLVTSESPFNEKVITKTPITWIIPSLICEVKFSMMTSDHRLRHPVFITIKEILDKAGVEGFIKTSGATGLHIYIPAGTSYNYNMVRDFACLICTMVYEIIPGFTTMERKVVSRGAKIYLDCHQNSQGQTIASVYSVRPRAGATVSTPLSWDEVNDHLDPKNFTIFNVLQRIENKGDLFSGVLGKGVNIQKVLKKLESS